MQQKKDIWIHRESDGQRLRSLLVNLMLDLGANDYDWTMRFAARGGHMDIVKLMISLGVNNNILAMIWAAEGGHMDIVKLMLFPSDFESSISSNFEFSTEDSKSRRKRSKSGEIEDSKSRRKGVNEYNYVMVYAA